MVHKYECYLGNLSLDAREYGQQLREGRPPGGLPAPAGQQDVLVERVWALARLGRPRAVGEALHPRLDLARVLRVGGARRVEEPLATLDVGVVAEAGWQINGICLA